MSISFQDLVHKKRDNDASKSQRHADDVTPMEEETPVTRRASSQSPKPRPSSGVRQRKKKEEEQQQQQQPQRLNVEDSGQGYPQISPDLPRKPPPKPKMKEPTETSELATEMRPAAATTTATSIVAERTSSNATTGKSSEPRGASACCSVAASES